ncbi:MAG TPA: DUF3341 domain-containing protein [Candidatus Binataceae bacterium]|nr:DUF3341 domain-containing protein [Candidatus Binataceae bacterium]
MSGEIALVSTFANEDDCARAIEELHAAHVHQFHAFTPYPSEKVQEAAQEARAQGRSPVRLWVLIGGITGFLSAIALTVGTSLEWNLNTGGRAVASIPPFIVIMFELMILFGGVSGVTGFFLHSGMPVFDPSPGFQPHFAADKFGLVVQCSEGDLAKYESILREAGAEDLRREAA